MHDLARGIFEQTQISLFIYFYAVWNLLLNRLQKFEVDEFTIYFALVNIFVKTFL